MIGRAPRPAPPTTDRRYGSRRWKRVRLEVLRRDLANCFVPGCDVVATVADHIIPVYPGMPDSLFFDLRNLRASCRHHNVARGVAARLARELGEAEPVPAVPSPFGYGRSRPPRSAVVTRDYSRGTRRE